MTDDEEVTFALVEDFAGPDKQVLATCGKKLVTVEAECAEDVEGMGLGPDKMARLAQMAVETAMAEPPGDVRGWVGVTFMVVIGVDLEVTTGWRHDCGFLLGGAELEEPPPECPCCGEP